MSVRLLKNSFCTFQDTISGPAYDVSTLSCIEFHEKQLLSEKFSIKRSSSQDKRRKW